MDFLLDYNCPDGTGEWVRSTLGDDLKSGRLIYWRTSAPNDFHFSHSRNMAAPLASGKILCLVDADNFTGQDFAFYVARNLPEHGAWWAAQWKATNLSLAATRAPAGGWP